jgi:hypothetical protein
MAARLGKLSDDQRRAVEAAVCALERLPDWKSAYEILSEQQQPGAGEEDHERKEARST